MQNSFDFLEIDRVLALLKPGRRLRIKPYSYPFNFAAIGAGLTVQATRVIDANCDFLWIASTISPTDQASVHGVQIQDTGSGEFYLPSSMPFTFVGGWLMYGQTGGNSIGLGFPRLIPANSNLLASITDISGGGASAGQLALHGVRVYEYG